jgi:hypothetical protein
VRITKRRVIGGLIVLFFALIVISLFHDDFPD